MPEKKLLIFVAINEEFKVVKKHLKDIRPQAKRTDGTKKGEFPRLSGTISGISVDLVMTTMGMNQAAKCADFFIDDSVYGAVLILGYCGGLSLALKNGDVVIPNKVTSSRDQKTFELDSELSEILGRVVLTEGHRYRTAPLITQPFVVETSDDKRLLFKKSLAEAVDMETSEIVRVSRAKNVKVSALKIVIDDIETELPNFNEIFARTGRMDRLSVTSAMIAHPHLSMALSANMKHAGATLHHILPPIIEKVCEFWKIEKSL